MTNNIPLTKTESLDCSGVWRLLYKRQPALCLTHCWDQREGEREMEQVTAVGKGNTFFLLLVLAACATATSLKSTQQNTAITATSDRQVRSVGCVHEPMTLDSLDLCGVTCNTHHTTTFSLSTEKKAIPSIPLKACTLKQHTAASTN